VILGVRMRTQERGRENICFPVVEAA